jgi:tRNA-splicing ligase RtcB
MKVKPHKIYAESLDPKTLSQFYDAMKCDFVVKGALMPDAHLGYSIPIGAVVATKGMIVPAWVGYDIGCGMVALKTTFKIDDIREHSQEIFDGIYRRIPVGANHNDRFTNWKEAETLPSTKVLKDLYDKNGGKQIGSLGGGNHFVEIGHDENDDIWIIIHSGSRNLGHRIATHYMKLASESDKAKEGNYPLDVTSVEGENYIMDLNFCLEFALQNRKIMIERVIRVIKETCEGDGNMRNIINRNHNHATEKDGLWIHRKGATHAEAGMEGVIPGNMRDGSFIVEGKGNPESLYSSSHGAGRVLSRRQAKETIDLKDFEETMGDITAKVGQSTIDESPFAYKDIFQVMKEQEDLVHVKHRVKPLINIKA